MNLSNLHNLHISRDFNNKPYYITFYCDINNSTYIIHLEKRCRWIVHYVSHWVENCTCCGNKVRLDSDCKPMTELLRKHFHELMQWLGEQKRNNPDLFRNKFK